MERFGIMTKVKGQIRNRNPKETVTILVTIPFILQFLNPYFRRTLCVPSTQIIFRKLSMLLFSFNTISMEKAT